MVVQHFGDREFLPNYNLSVLKEFDFDGHVAAWADEEKAHRFWGDEDQTIPLFDFDPDRLHNPVRATVLAPNGRFLVIALGDVVKVLDVETWLISEEFRNVDGAISHARLAFSRQEENTADRGYSLLLNDVGGVRAYALSAKGCLESQTPTWTRDHAKILGFNSEFASHDGRFLALVVHGETTQSVDRYADLLPQIAIVLADTFVEVGRLQGHTDSIMWASWSKDDKHIISASWDGTFPIWDVQTGICRHVIGPHGRQEWAGGLFADETLVFLSGFREVAVYEIETGRLVAQLDDIPGFHMFYSPRWFAVHPHETLLVLQYGTSLLAWRPTGEDDTHPRVQHLLKVEESELSIERGFRDLKHLEWVDEGKKFIASGRDGTIFVWDKERGVKWRFQRPVEVPCHGGRGDALYNRSGSKEEIISVDGDGKIRIWQL